MTAVATRPRPGGDLRLMGDGNASGPKASPRVRPARQNGVVPASAMTVNGRFYGQAVTGVQRYGREVVDALDPLLDERGLRAVLALPRHTSAPATLRAFEAEPSRHLGGHAWEQWALAARGAPLLNLCNTGPVLARRQVLCLHDINVLLEPGSYRAGFRVFYGLLQPLLARRAAVLTSVSRFSADTIAARFGLPRDRVVVLPNGHEHALRWRPDPEVLRRWPGERPFVLLLGSRARHKNAGLLMRLAPALDARGLDLVVAGGSAPIFAAEPDGPEPRNLHRLGAVSDGALATLLSRALCLAFPSWTEGFGLPIVEAMALGCPVVASNRASMPEVCGTAALMAPPDDPAAWLAALGALQDSATLRTELSGRGAEQVRRFRWTETARGYLDLLERLA
ncbi:glycosyltransferase family 1 protein [Lichenihabitans sp. Uapishka_5]|uniref:glycosyltransferase family 4 protein n=1 Tax=Lichenihabitans sp. Uapishka_5 TaxID=3037302 RepID=UPI0029E7EFF0|nr:glycosyltransferase family 1 protein [Lichenihabitans sp. Uapishka_5]MDX7950399.1 glycosyltransferase family 1 protein [Lichenihabitans sp. Uapishka_5]